MKKIVAVIGLMLIAGVAKADTLLDQFYFGFVGNAKFAYETTTDGVSHGEFLDNVVEIGQLKGEHLAALDFGVLGDFLPDTNEFQAAKWTTGGKIHVAPLIKNYVSLPDGWAFLRTLEIDARGSYNWTERHPKWGLVAAYPFR